MRDSHRPARSYRGARSYPSFAEAFRFWVKLGFISFGGPAGQIAIMQTELVDRKKWISQARGPEPQQLATYIGWLLHKTWGGIVAGAFFVIPSIFVLWGLSYIYAAYGHVLWIAAIFYGLKPAVTAIVLAAVIRIGRKALRNEVMWSIAAIAFVAIYFFQVQFPVIVLGAGLLGLLSGRFWPEKFYIVSGHGGMDDASVLGDDEVSSGDTRPGWARSLKVIVLCVALWIAPTLIVAS